MVASWLLLFIFLQCDAKKYTVCRWAQKWGIGRVKGLLETCWSANLLAGRRAGLMTKQHIDLLWGETSSPTKSPYQE